tara:strand:+ start:1308 stop:1439 length:132 start_codon:yes stop_codon:yes gene_type:complete
MDIKDLMTEEQYAEALEQFEFCKPMLPVNTTFQEFMTKTFRLS